MTDMTTGAYRDPNETPPLAQAVPLGLQHVLAMFASNVTPSIIVAGAAGLAFGGPEQVYLIQMAMLFAGIATLFQTVGLGPVGARLPIMQGTSFAFVGVLAGIAATQGSGRGADRLYHRRRDPLPFGLRDQAPALALSAAGHRPRDPRHRPLPHPGRDQIRRRRCRLLSRWKPRALAP